MKDSIRHKLESVRDRFEELAGLLADPEVIGDQNQFRELSKEYSRVEPIVKLFSDFESIDDDMAAAREMTEDSDDEVRKMGEEELATLETRHETLELELQKALIRPTRTTTATSTSRSAPGPAATKPRFSRATCSACTPDTPRPWAGKSRS